mgnify:CR=1 FL=1
MRAERYPRHARVCERQTGTGITLAMIEERGLPFPHRDFMPETLEEQLICYADKFYSKTKLDKEKSVEKIDGIVATIMAIDRCIRHQKKDGSSYDERGIISF